MIEVMTLSEIAKVLTDKPTNFGNKNKIIAKGHRLSYIMMYTELSGIICSGARQGNQLHMPY